MTPNTSGTRGNASYPRAFQQPSAPVSTTASVSAPERTSGRRLALLAAILYNPVILIGYLLYLYGPSQHCVAGPLCQFGEYPGFLQIVVLLLGAWLLWLLLDVGVRWLLEAPGWQGRLTRGLRAISEYESARELLGAMGVALMAGMVVALLARRLTPTVLILGAFTAGVSIRAALLRDGPLPTPKPKWTIRAKGQPEAAPAAQPALESSGPVFSFVPVTPYTPSYTPPAYGPSHDIAPDPTAPDYAPPLSGPIYTAPPPAAPMYTAPRTDPPAQSAPGASSAPPLYSPPPEFLPPQQLLSPSDPTYPSGWEGQEL